MAVGVGKVDSFPRQTEVYIHGHSPIATQYSHGPTIPRMGWYSFKRVWRALAKPWVFNKSILSPLDLAIKKLKSELVAKICVKALSAYVLSNC